MSLWNRLFRRESKLSDARRVIAMNRTGDAVNTPRNYESFSKEGYQKNVIAYRAVSNIAKACGGIPWVLKSGDREIENHKLLTLLKRPNPMQGQAAFIEALIAYYCIAGNTYIEKVGPSPKAPPQELWAQRPDRMKLVPGSSGLPSKYIYSMGAYKKEWLVDQLTGLSQVLHIKTFNPLDDWYGMSPIEAAVFSVDQHNESGKWNLSLLQNSATPSGAFIFDTKDKGAVAMSDDQFANLKNSIEENYSGSRNAGRPLLLEGGLDWKQMSFSPKDMDWINSKNTSARDIALAFGYPPLLLNIPGDNTFSNYKEARMAFYEDTVIPLMDHVRDELNNSITPAFGEGLKLDYDQDEIEALAPKREAKWNTIKGSDFLTVNEKREALGYDKHKDGDVLLVASSLVPIEQVGQEDQSSNNSPNDSTQNVGDENDQDPQEQVEDTEKAVTNSEPEIKLINLVNQKEKDSAWKKQNSKREKFSNAFKSDLNELFKAQAKELGSTLKNIKDPRLAEFAAVQAISKDSAKFKSVLSKHIKKTLVGFGYDLLESGKSIAPSETKSKTKFDQFVEHFVETRSANAIAQIEGTSIKKARAVIREVLSEGIQDGEANTVIANRLEEKFDGLSTSRSHTIARTEIGIASNQGSLEAAKALEVPNLLKEWVSVDDARTRGNEPDHSPDHPNHASMNGVRVELTQKFTVPPDADMDGPGDPTGGVDQVANCRCVLVYTRG